MHPSRVQRTDRCAELWSWNFFRLEFADSGDQTTLKCVPHELLVYINAPLRSRLCACNDTAFPVVSNMSVCARLFIREFKITRVNGLLPFFFVARDYFTRWINDRVDYHFKQCPLNFGTRRLMNDKQSPMIT